MADKTQAEKDSEARVDKAAWMNGQIADRLEHVGAQEGVAAAKDARAEGEYPAAKSPTIKGDVKAAPKP